LIAGGETIEYSAHVILKRDDGVSSFTATVSWSPAMPQVWR